MFSNLYSDFFVRVWCSFRPFSSILGCTFVSMYKCRRVQNVCECGWGCEKRGGGGRCDFVCFCLSFICKKIDSN